MKSELPPQPLRNFHARFHSRPVDGAVFVIVNSKTQFLRLQEKYGAAGTLCRASFSVVHGFLCIVLINTFVDIIFCCDWNGTSQYLCCLYLY